MVDDQFVELAGGDGLNQWYSYDIRGFFLLGVLLLKTSVSLRS